MLVRYVFAVTPEQLAHLMLRVADGTVTQATARRVFAEMWARQSGIKEL